ncbi:MAG TPA: hypothetical protein VK325_10695 [Pseudoxanthomonas sp.]|nr:hypothetical protein [Pseudoxanthomonas sp.]
MKKSPLLLLVVFAALLIGTTILWSHYRPGSSTTVETTAGKPDLPAPKASASDSEGPKLEPSERQDDRADNIRMRFERANDLYSYVDELIEKANAGDADAAWMISRVYDYCGRYSANPAGYSKESEIMAAASSATAAALTAHRQDCLQMRALLAKGRFE